MSDIEQAPEDQKLPRVLYISHTPPIPTWGGSMAFFRHFVECDRFPLRVMTNARPIAPDLVPYQPLYFSPSRLTQRLFRTRLLPLIYGPHLLAVMGRIPGKLMRAARAFAPDIVFTVAGSWDWSALVAERVARRLHVPLAASFNDWFDYGWFPVHPLYKGAIERRFRRFYRESDLAFCTCEGMKEALGPHANSRVLYPIGAPMRRQEGADSDAIRDRFRIGYTGSLGAGYGLMLQKLIEKSEEVGGPFDFRIWGSNPDWSPLFGKWAKKSGIYLGQLPFAVLSNAIEEVDALLLVMSFEPKHAHFERTSFKTKFLDYLSHGKPIAVWGPDHCSAVRVAREFDSAEICVEPHPTKVLTAFHQMQRSVERRRILLTNARRMYENRFNPTNIHAGFIGALRETVGCRASAGQAEQS